MAVTILPSTGLPTADWRSRGLCLLANAMGNPAGWITEKGEERERAEKVCGDCPVSRPCLSDALMDKEAYGLRAGFFFDRGALTIVEHRRLLKWTGMRSKIRQAARTKKTA